MLEGKELEGKIGSVGEYSVDVDDKGVVTVSVGAKIDLLDELQKLAAKSNTTLDDKIVAYLKLFLGRA